MSAMADFAAELTATPDAISALTERAAGFLRNAGVEARAAYHVALVLEELLTNVAAYGGTDAPVSVSMMVSPERVTAEVVDGGAMFDPRVERNLDVSAAAEDRPVGGLGLWLVQRVTGGPRRRAGWGPKSNDLFDLQDAGRPRGSRRQQWNSLRKFTAAWWW